MNYFSFFKWNLKRIKNNYLNLKQQYRLEKKLHPSVTIEEDVTIIKRSNLCLGRDIHICRGTILDCGGGEWSGNKGKITIGDHVYISYNAILLGAGEIEIQKSAKIGNQAFITSYTPDGKKLTKDPKLFDNPIVPHDFKKVTIGERAMIGPGSIILTGVTVGHDAIISPGSIIRHDVPPHTFVFPNTRLHNRTYRPKN